MTALPITPTEPDPLPALTRAVKFPRLRYMGSKYKLLPHLAAVFAEVGGTTALDAFRGSGVVSYLMKAQGYQVTSNDFLQFPQSRARPSSTTRRLSPRRTSTESADRGPTGGTSSARPSAASSSARPI